MKTNILYLILSISILPKILTTTEDIYNELNELRKIRYRNKIKNPNIINNTYYNEIYEDTLYTSNIHNSPSIINFFKEVYNSIFSYNVQELNNYFSGLKEILSVFKDIILFQKRKSNTNIYTNINEKKTFKREELYSNNNLNFRKLNGILIYNNTDLRNKTVCTYEPYLDSKIYIYVCNDTVINKTKYEELKNDTFNDCQIYTLYDYICLCPVSTQKCKKDEIIYCTLNNLQCNNKNLLEGYNTFYNEYQNKEDLKYSEKKYKFNLGLTCFTESKNTTVNGANFDININDNYDFDILNTLYKYNTTSKKQYKKEDILNKNTKIFEYFNYDNKMILYDNSFNLYCNFSIYDVKWLIPVKVQTFSIPKKDIKSILLGNQQFVFDIIIDDILNNYNRKDLKSFSHLSDLSKNNKGIDTLYFEITIYSDNKQIVFFNYIGDINLLK